MATVVNDSSRESNASFEYDAYNVLIRGSVDRSFIVTDLTLTAGSNFAKAAITAVGIAVGTAHPDYALLAARNIKVMEHQGDPYGAKVIITYKYDRNEIQGTGTIEYESTVTQEQIDSYTTGGTLTAIRVPWYQGVEVGASTAGVTPLYGHGVVSVWKPVKSLVITRNVNTTGASSIQSAIDTYLGKLNSGTWRSGAARTWLCASITVTGDWTYSQTVLRAKAVFWYNPQTWTPVARYTNQNLPGGMPNNLYKGTSNSDAANNGFWRVEEAYDTVSFTALETLFGL
jgi:hypothetical protein